MKKVANQKAVDTRKGSLFNSLMSYDINKRVFINMEEGLEKGVLEHPDFRGYKSVDMWKDLHCKTRARKVGPFVVKTDCKTPDGRRQVPDSDPSKHKVFVKLGNRKLENMWDYAKLIQEGVIREEDHNKLFRFIETQREKVKRESGAMEDVVAFNHNMDVPVLHFKFKCRKHYKCGPVATRFRRD